MVCVWEGGGDCRSQNVAFQCFQTDATRHFPTFEKDENIPTIIHDFAAGSPSVFLC